MLILFAVSSWRIQEQLSKLQGFGYTVKLDDKAFCAVSALGWVVAGGPRTRSTTVTVGCPSMLG